MKAASLVIFLILLAYWIWPRSSNSQAEKITEVGVLSDLPKCFDLFQTFTPPIGTLIISLNNPDSFVQFSRDGKYMEIDFPIITDKQKALESKFRMACKNQNLEVIERYGSDGSLFLDAELPLANSERATLVKNILVEVFKVTEGEKLLYTLF